MTQADVVGESVVTEALPGSQLGLTIEIPQEQVDEAYRRVLQRLAQRVRIGGFRPGKAPPALVEARIGQPALRDEVTDYLVPRVVAKALRDRNIDAIDQPRVEELELERGRPARVVARVSVMPEVALPDLDALQVERTRTEVTDDLIDRRIDGLLRRIAEVEPVEREVRAGDVVVADLKVLADGQELAARAQKAAELEVDEGLMPPELLAALPGHVQGDVVGVDVSLPEDDPDPDLRGKPARLELTVHGIKEKRVPELTDEVAAQLSAGTHETVADLREAVRADLVEAGRQSDELAFEHAVIRAVTEGATLEVPTALVEREVDRRMEDLERQLRRRGLRLDRYLDYLGRSEEAYREELEPDARERLKVELVLDEVGRRLDVQVSEDEVTERLRAEAEHDPELAGRIRELESSRAVRQYFRDRLVRARTVQLLKEKLGANHLEGGTPTMDSEQAGEGDAPAAAEHGEAGAS
jgi:trigger factor